MTSRGEFLAPGFGLRRVPAAIAFALCGLTLLAVASCEGDPPAGRAPAPRTFQNTFIEPIRSGTNVAGFLSRAARQVAKYEAPEGTAVFGGYFLWLHSPLMPDGGYPSVELPVTTPTALATLPPRWRSFGFYVHAESPTRLSLRWGPHAAEWELSAGDSTVTVTRTTEGDLLCIKRSCRRERNSDAGAPRPFDIVSAHGDVRVRQFQAYSEQELLRYVTFAGHPKAVPRHHGEGQQTPHWSSASAQLAEAALGLGVLAHACRRESPLYRECPDPSLAGRARLVLRTILDRLMAWPKWRAAAPSAPEGGSSSWDRNSWASGQIPLAVALSALAIRDELSPERWNAVRRRVRQRGLRWLDHDSFPSVKHWVRRSTNHSAYMLGGGGAAALLTGDCLAGPVGRRVIHDAFAVAEQAFADGGYLEGPRYLAVFVDALFPLLWVHSRCTGAEWPEYVNRRAAFLQRMAAFVRDVSDSDGHLLAPFGDTYRSGPRGKPWPEPVPALTGAPTGAPRYASLVLPRLPQPEPTAGLTCRAYTATGYATARIQRDDLRATVGLASTRLHRSHNKQYDINTLYVEKNGRHVITEAVDPRRKNAAYLHSALAIKGVTLLDPTDPFSTCGTSGCGPRSVNGKVLPIEQGPHSCRMTGFVDQPYLEDNAGSTAVQAYRRDVSVFDLNAPTIVVLDTVQMAEGAAGLTLLSPWFIPSMEALERGRRSIHVPTLGTLLFPFADRLTLREAHEGTHVFAEYKGGERHRSWVTILLLADAAETASQVRARRTESATDTVRITVDVTDLPTPVTQRVEFAGEPIELRLLPR